MTTANGFGRLRHTKTSERVTAEQSGLQGEQGRSAEDVRSSSRSFLLVAAVVAVGGIVFLALRALKVV